MLPNEMCSPDLPTNTLEILNMAKISGSQIRDNTITGADVDEGSLRFPIDVVTSNLTLDSAHHTVLVASEGSITITLPSASSYSGKVYIIRRLSSGSVTISAGDQIEGDDGDYGLGEEGEGITIQSDGGKWWIIGMVSTGHD